MYIVRLSHFALVPGLFLLTQIHNPLLDTLHSSDQQFHAQAEGRGLDVHNIKHLSTCVEV